VKYTGDRFRLHQPQSVRTLLFCLLLFSVRSDSSF
jgi:hypothetical protein